jgi:predicted permease
VAAIVLTLSLGIGASVGMFSVLHGVVLRALPYPDDDRLMLPYVEAPNLAGRRAGFTGAEAAEGLTGTPGFEATAYYAANEPPYTFPGADVPRQLSAVRVSAGFFPVFAVPAELGRTFVAADFEQPRPVAVLSHAAWMELTGGDAGAVGRTLEFEEGAFELVGVLPASFKEPAGGDIRLYVPFLESDLLRPGYQDSRQIFAVGRLAPGVSRAEALAALATRLDAVNAEHNTAERGQRYGLVRLIDDLVGDASAVLFGLFAVGLLVLLIACSTAGSLVGIRFEQRATELAVRRALGAGSARLVKDAAYELALLAAAAAVAGVLAAQLIVLALRPLAAANLPRADGIAVDAATLWFAAAATGATVLLTGVANLSSLLKDPGSPLRAGVPQLVEGGRRPPVLAVAAVGMSAAALAAALALSASLIRLSDVDPGIRTSNVVTLSLGLLRRPDAEADQALDRVLEAVRAIPGVVDAAAMMFGLPTATGMTKAHGRATPGGESVFVGIQMGSESYHRLLGIQIRRGRDFAETDVAGGTRVAVINETLARALFPDTDPIGRTVYLAGNEIPFEIVGIAADRRNAGLRAPPDPEVVASIRQWELSSPETLLVRWAGKPPDGWARLLETTINEVDPRQPVAGGIALDDHLRAQTRSLRLFAFATNCFAVLALVLCALGVNAVIAAMQQRREREMGLRMALGASPRQAGALVLATAARIVGFGLVLAALLAVPTFSWLRSQLFDVDAVGFWTLFATAALVSAAAGLVAALSPVRRAARVAPMQALRYE